MSAEAPAEQLAKLQNYELELGKALHLLEKDIYVRESRYLDESQTMGNVVHVSAGHRTGGLTVHVSDAQGWDGLTDTKTAASRKSGSLEPANRVFSNSSHSSNKVIPDAKAQMMQANASQGMHSYLAESDA